MVCMSVLSGAEDFCATAETAREKTKITTAIRLIILGSSKRVDCRMATDKLQKPPRISRISLIPSCLDGFIGVDPWLLFDPFPLNTIEYLSLPVLRLRSGAVRIRCRERRRGSSKHGNPAR